MCVVPAEFALLHFAKKILQVTQKVPQWRAEVGSSTPLLHILMFLSHFSFSCNSSSGAGLMTPSEVQILAVRTPWKPPQRDVFLSICHTRSEQGVFLIVFWEKEHRNWETHGYIKNLSMPIQMGFTYFLIYFSFVNLSIFLFECVYLWAE